jgi:hypothetical protein
MSIYSLPREYDKFSDQERNSLTFLRSARDIVADHLAFELNTEKAGEWINDMVTFDGPWNGYNHARARIMEFSPEYISSRFAVLELLRRIVFRIARLEREGCGVPKERWDRELLNA